MLRALARIFRRPAAEEEWLPLPYEEAIMVPAPSRPFVDVAQLHHEARRPAPLIRNRQASWQVMARRQFACAMREPWP